MLTKRIIPCLDVKEGKVVKGIKFFDHAVVGDILPLADFYREAGADEIVFYDITASAEDRTVSRDWIVQIAKLIDVPFCVAGGIRSVAYAREILNAGADKISVNSPALERPALINELAREFGSQCVVVGVDSQWIDGNYLVYQYTGSAARIQSTRKLTMDWIVEAQSRGAGEIVLNCMASDGVGTGYDLTQLALAKSRLSIPLIGSGGARLPAHFIDLFKRSNVDGALAAGAFHRREISVGEVKESLQKAGIPVRL